MSGIAVPKRLRTANENARKSRVQEGRAAKKFGAELVPGSGAGRVKGDVRKHKVFRLECKVTKHKSFSVTERIIQDLEDAVPMGMAEIPFLQVDILDGKQSVYLFPASVISEVIEALERSKAE